jgi:hypothetical protein
MNYTEFLKASTTPHKATPRTRETADLAGIGACTVCTLPIAHKIHISPAIATTEAKRQRHARTRAISRRQLRNLKEARP